jgi:hypothetical protein
LRLVADFGEANDQGRYQKRFHDGAGVGRQTNLGTASCDRPGYRGTMPNVSPLPSDTRTMAEAKYVDAGPSINEGGYSLMEER